MPAPDFELIAVVLLSVALAIVLALYEKLARDLKSYRADKDLFEARARQRAIKVVEGAKDRALAILEEAKLQAQNDKQDLSEELQKASQQQIENYKQTLQNISKAIEEDAKNEVDDFKKLLETEAVGAQKSMTTRVEGEYVKANQTVEEYKKRRLAEVDQNIFEILRDVSKDIIPMGMSFEQHSELVKAALEEAKRQHVI
jgi:hypothetical protein